MHGCYYPKGYRNPPLLERYESPFGSLRYDGRPKCVIMFARRNDARYGLVMEDAHETIEKKRQVVEHIEALAAR